MGNNSSLYLQNYTLNLIATDLHGHACMKKCNSEACPKPPSCPAPSAAPSSPSSQGPIYKMEETNLDNNSPCPVTEFELCPTPTPSPTPTPTPETTPTSEYTIPVPTPPTQSELERIIQLANNASIINSMKTDPIALKKFLEIQYGITDNQFCLLQDLILGGFAMPNELYDLAKNLVVIDMMKKDPGNLFKYLTIQYRITACQFELLRQLILGPTNFNCLNRSSRQNICPSDKPCSSPSHTNSYRSFSRQSANTAKSCVVGGCAGTQYGCPKTDPEGSNCPSASYGDIHYSSVGVLPGELDGFYNWNFVVSSMLRTKCPLFIFKFDFSNSSSTEDEILFSGGINGYITYDDTVYEASKFVTFNYNNDTKKVEIVFHANRLYKLQQPSARFFMNIHIKHEPLSNIINDPSDSVDTI